MCNTTAYVKVIWTHWFDSQFNFLPTPQYSSTLHMVSCSFTVVTFGLFAVANSYKQHAGSYFSGVTPKRPCFVSKSKNTVDYIQKCIKNGKSNYCLNLRFDALTDVLLDLFRTSRRVADTQMNFFESATINDVVDAFRIIFQVSGRSKVTDEVMYSRCCDHIERALPWRNDAEILFGNGQCQFKKTLYDLARYLLYSCP